MTSSSARQRLDGADFTYWFLDRALGWSVVLQMIWTFPDRVSAERLRTTAIGLSTGRLHRRVVLPTVWGARPSWVRANGVLEPRCDTEPVDEPNVLAWADDELYGVDLDPVAGRCWRLHYAPTTGGGSVLSLCTLHLVTDGRGFVSAAAEAFGTAGLPGAAEAVGAGAVDEAVGRDGDDAPMLGARARAADVVDTAGQLSRAVGGVARVVASSVFSPAGSGPSDPRRPRRPIATRAPEARVRWALVTVATEDWNRAASAHDGTANALFIAVVCGAMRRAGAVPDAEPIKVGIPVSQRTVDDGRANATAGVSVFLDSAVGGGRGLRTVRDECRAAYTALGAGRRTNTVHLQPLVTLLPLSVTARAVTSGGGMPDAMTSNIGAFGAGARTLGGQTATAVAFRGDAQNVDPGEAHRFGDGLQSWMLDTDGVMTLSVAAFDESAFATAADLRTALSAELDGWGVPFASW